MSADQLAALASGPLAARDPRRRRAPVAPPRSLSRHDRRLAATARHRLPPARRRRRARRRSRCASPARTDSDRVDASARRRATCASVRSRRQRRRAPLARHRRSGGARGARRPRGRSPHATAARDWLRRPRLTVHLDRVTIRERNGTSAQLLPDVRAPAARRRRGAPRAASARSRRSTAFARSARERARTRRAGDQVGAARGRAARAPAYSDRSASRVPVTRDRAAHPRVFQSRAQPPRVPAIACSRWPRIDARRCASASASCRSSARTSTSSSWCAWPGCSPRQRAKPAESERGDGLTPAEAARRDSRRRRRDHRATGGMRPSMLRRRWRDDGVRVVSWAELDAEQQAALRDRFRDEIQPLLTPFAMTLSPGHPLPRLGASLARDRDDPAQSGRRSAALRRAGASRDVAALLHGDRRRSASASLVALEEVVRGESRLALSRTSTRRAGVRLPRDAQRRARARRGARRRPARRGRARDGAARSGSGRAPRGRAQHAARSCARCCSRILRREQAATERPARHRRRGGRRAARSARRSRSSSCRRRSVARLSALRAATARSPARASTFDAVAQRRRARSPPVRLVQRHRRRASFARRRPIRDVAAIKITLYRVGNPSPIADALLEAARAGKAVTAFVELKARFDEEVNVGWARALEAAGGHVVRGLVGFKNHAKVALVVRREGEATRAATCTSARATTTRARASSTRISVCSRRTTLIANDVADLFNELTGIVGGAASRVARAARRAASSAAGNPRAHRSRSGARARGPPGADHREAQRPLRSGRRARAVPRRRATACEIDLVVRGICTLGPGVLGRSERIRVISVVGRFLEHSRIYRFAQRRRRREYFIGSADLRPRNLRRRVELLVPIRDEPHRRCSTSSYRGT